MTTQYHLVMTIEAAHDLDEIAEYIRQDSPQNAVEMAITLAKSIDSLVSMPEQFRHVGKSRKRFTDVHVMVVHPFLVYYRIKKTPAAVFVLRVIHGARRQPRRFRK